MAPRSTPGARRMSALLPIYPPRALAPAPELNGELSPEEIAFIPEVNAQPWKPSGLPVAEIDCELIIPGQRVLAVTLAVWGKFQKARKGGHEPGERPYEPDDPAGFEIEAVLMGDVDVTAELGQPGEEALAAHVMENCEPDSDGDGSDDGLSTRHYPSVEGDRDDFERCPVFGIDEGEPCEDRR